ncbi:unnamed protein product [Closterium sp. NIES-54]
MAVVVLLAEVADDYVRGGKSTSDKSRANLLALVAQTGKGLGRGRADGEGKGEAEAEADAKGSAAGAEAGTAGGWAGEEAGLRRGGVEGFGSHDQIEEEMTAEPGVCMLSYFGFHLHRPHSILMIEQVGGRGGVLVSEGCWYEPLVAVGGAACWGWR